MFRMSSTMPSNVRTARAYVKTRFISSRAFPFPLATVEIDDFQIDPIPSGNREQEAIFRFEFFHRTRPPLDLEKMQLANIGEIESRMWLALLSLIGESNVRFQGTSVNGESTSAQRLKYRFSQQPPIDFSVVEHYYEMLAQLRGRDRERFVNSARIYQSAVSLMDSNPSLSFFLFVVTVECLSNYVEKTGKSREKFVRFIAKYLHASMSREKSDLFKFEHRLDTAYRIRNSFVHAGQDMPGTVWLADRLDLPSVIYLVQGKERRAPGLIWLEKIVRSSLLGFLEARVQERQNKPKKPVFRTLANRANVLHLKKKKGIAIQKGQPITADMLELD